MIPNQHRFSQTFFESRPQSDTPPAGSVEACEVPLPRILRTAMAIRVRCTLGTRSGHIIGFNHVTREPDTDWLTLRNVRFYYPAAKDRGVGGEVDIRLEDIAWLRMEPRK